MSVEQLSIYELLVIARDPSERKHKGSPESVAAHARVLPTKEAAMKKVLDYVKEHPRSTVHEIAFALGYGKAINRVSGRISDLKALNRLRKVGVRDRAAELEAV